MNEANITFNPEKHSYKIDDQPVKSVTQLLQEYGLVPQYFSKNAATRGTYVHKAIDLFLKENLDEESLDPVIQPYLKSFKEFYNSEELLTTESEQIVGALVFGVAGTVDWFGQFNGESYLLDWKASQKITSGNFLQVEFYKKLVNYVYDGEIIQKTGIVQLFGDGKKAKLHEPKGNEKAVVESIITIETFKSWGKK